MHCWGAKSGWQLGDGDGAGKIDTTRARLFSRRERGQYIPGRASGLCVRISYIFIYLFAGSLLHQSDAPSPCKSVPETKAPASFDFSYRGFTVFQRKIVKNYISHPPFSFFFFICVSSREFGKRSDERKITKVRPAGRTNERNSAMNLRKRSL